MWRHCNEYVRSGPSFIECFCILNLSLYWHVIEMHIATPKWYSFCYLIYQQWLVVLVLPDQQQTWSWPFKFQTNGLVQDHSNSIANTLELLQSCTKPLIFHMQSCKVEIWCSKPKRVQVFLINIVIESTKPGVYVTYPTETLQSITQMHILRIPELLRLSCFIFITLITEMLLSRY